MISRELTQVEKTWELEPIWDRFVVHMKDNETGETRVVDPGLTWYSHSPFFWQEGNFSCDCNRGDLFYGGEDIDCHCGHKRFTVMKAVFPDGTEVAIDG